MSNIFSDFNIYRPSEENEKSMRTYIETSLFNEFKEGEYTDEKEINNIIQYIYVTYEKIFLEKIKLISQRTLLVFLLEQYDRTVDAYKYIRKNNVYVKEWQENGPIIRRAIKYMIEYCVIDYEKTEIDIFTEENRRELDLIYICAEEMCRLSMSSEATLNVFPEWTRLKLKKGENIYYELINENDYVKNGLKRVNYDEILRNITPIDSDWGTINEYLKEGSINNFRCELKDLFSVLQSILLNAVEDAIPFVQRIQIINGLIETLNINEVQVRKFLSGLVINKENLLKEDRKIYKPKQEYRALKRFLIEVPHRRGKHYVWSRGMVIECMTMLVQSFAYKGMPKEWKNATMDRCIERVSNEVGTWFEKLTYDELLTRKIYGMRSMKKCIGTKACNIKIPSDIGEIDYIGFDIKKKQFLLIECKMISPATEPRYFRDDVDKFLKSKKAYKDKFLKKIEWVDNNFIEIFEVVMKQLKLEKSVSISDVTRRNILLTYYPTVVEGLIDNFEIHTLYEFLKQNEM